MSNNTSPKQGEERERRLSPRQQRLFDFMLANGTITALQAIEHLADTKLATTISELRREHGIEVKKVWVKSVNRFGEPVHFMQYSLAMRGQ